MLYEFIMKTSSGVSHNLLGAIESDLKYEIIIVSRDDNRIILEFVSKTLEEFMGKEFDNLIKNDIFVNESEKMKINGISYNIKKSLFIENSKEYELYKLYRLNNVDQYISRDLIDYSPIHIAVLNKDCEILYLNKSYGEENLVGIKLTKLIEEEDRSIFESEFNKILSNTESSSFVVKTVQGISFTNYLKGIKINGKIDRIISFGIDITEIVKIRNHLEDENFYYQQLLHQLPSGIIITNTDRIITDWLGSSEEIYGYRKEEVIGKSIDFISPRNQPIISKIIDFINDPSESKVIHNELIAIRKDAKELIINASISMLYDKKKDPIGTIGVGFDVTKEKIKEKINKELEFKIQKHHKMEALGNLASAVAHEFNNLFMGVMGYSSMILDILEENHKVYPMINIIQNTIDQAALLSNQMLSLAGHDKFNMKVLNLNDKINDLKLLFRGSVPKKVIIEYDLLEDLPNIWIDESQIRHVITNLIANAYESIDDVGKIKVKTTKNNNFVILKIIDTGCGMSKSTKEMIFDPFYSEKGTGRGLGLSVVDKIVKSSNGIIDVTTSLGNGSTFSVFLPITVKEREEKINEENSGDQNFSGHIIICDDEPIVLHIVSKMMIQLGFQTTKTNNGRECIEVLKTNGSIILCILDISMPEMSGIEVLDEIRKFNIDLPVILTSGYSRDKIGDATRKKNVGFLQKPYRFDDLKSLLSRFIKNE